MLALGLSKPGVSRRTATVRGNSSTRRLVFTMRSMGLAFHAHSEKCPQFTAEVGKRKTASAWRREGRSPEVRLGVGSIEL